MLMIGDAPGDYEAATKKSNKLVCYAVYNDYSLDIDIEQTAVTKELIEKVHTNGHRINCWTCNDKKTLKNLFLGALIILLQIFLNKI